MIDMQELIRIAVKNPAKSIGLDLGEIKENQKADLILFNPNSKRVVKNKQSLYDEEELNGEITYIN
jgi:dihydroorotase